MSPKEQYLCVIANDILKKADAIIILEGDGVSRVAQGAKLYKEGWAPLVVISGGLARSEYNHSIPAAEMKPVLLEAGVPEDAIVLEEISWHTRGQAEEVVKMTQARGWKRILIVASHYHQYRAYLTFFKVIQEMGLERKLELINAPARQLPWFTKDEQGRRIDLLAAEFDRIDLYREKGHIASYEDAITYQEWKESQE